jgi:hypothetical protein
MCSRFPECKKNLLIFGKFGTSGQTASVGRGEGFPALGGSHNRAVM